MNFTLYNVTVEFQNTVEPHKSEQWMYRVRYYHPENAADLLIAEAVELAAKQQLRWKPRIIEITTEDRELTSIFVSPHIKGTIYISIIGQCVVPDHPEWCAEIK